MKLSCEIVQDLLPLVVEGLSSEQTQAAVIEHVAVCSECRRVKLQLEQDVVPKIAPEVPLREVKNAITAKRRRTVGIAVGMVLAVVFCVFARLTEPVWLPYSNDLLTVEALEVGDLVVTVSQPHSGITVDSAGGETTLSVWKNAISPQNDRETVVIPREQLGSALYYADFAGEDTLIWGSTSADGRQTLPRLVMGYYLVIAAGSVVILGILAVVVRKKKLGKPLFYLWLAPVCYLIAHLGVMGLNTITADAVRSLGWILAAAICLYLAAVSFIRLGWRRH